MDLRQVEPRLEDFLLTEILFKAGARKIAFDAKILIKMLLRSLPSLSMERISGKILVVSIVQLSSVADPHPGFGAFLTPGSVIRNPGWLEKSRSESGKNST